MLLDENEKDFIELKNVEGLVRQKKEGDDKRLSEMIDISFALTIDVQVILSRQRWMIGNSKYWEKSICPTTLLPPKHHVHVGRQRKKRQRNTGYNKATCKGQGRKATTGGNNAEAGGLSAAAGEGGAGGPGSAGVASQGSSHSRWTKRRVQTERINGRVMGDGVPTQSSVAGGASEWSFL
ncbi:hypothetical protein Tco_0714923 [Tanacetum coccineum]